MVVVNGTILTFDSMRPDREQVIPGGAVAFPFFPSPSWEGEGAGEGGRGTP